MTRERLEALHEIRDQANDLWMKLLTDHDGSDHSLNFIDREHRRMYRSAVRLLIDDINNFIHDELGVER